MVISLCKEQLRSENRVTRAVAHHYTDDCHGSRRDFLGVVVNVSSKGTAETNCY